jgi:haloacid dehalogenase-like hydrolase
MEGPAGLARQGCHLSAEDRASGRPDLARIRLVATDMDGTLLDPAGSVSRRTIAAVAAARAAGVHVIP